MIQLGNAKIRATLEKLKLPTPEGGRLHILGIRGAVPADGAPRGYAAVTRQRNVPNYYNDSIVVFGTAIRPFLGSVDPGSTYTDRPLNAAGCAHLMNGAYHYRVGEHKGNVALVQAAPVKVWRDGDRDHAQDPHELVEDGWFGINIHAGGHGPNVNGWSAGCQIIQGGWDNTPWLDFISLVTHAHGFGQQRFRYYLIDAGDLL